jgi:hypothetical protein
VEKIIPWESSFPLFYLRDRKVEKELSPGNLFSTFEYPFLPWTIFFSGTRQTILFTRAILFS